MKITNFLIAFLTSLVFTGCAAIKETDTTVKVGTTYLMTSDWCAMSPNEDTFELFPNNCSKWEGHSYWKNRTPVPKGTCIQLGRMSAHIESQNKEYYPSSFGYKLETHYYVLTTGIEAIISGNLLPSKTISWDEIKESQCTPK